MNRIKKYVVNILHFFSRRWYILSVLFAFLIFWNSLPEPLFQDPFSTILEDRNNNLLGAHISKDEQWRFPSTGRYSARFLISLVTFEDKNFFYHNGVDPWAFARALKQNISGGSIISGGSTITMQVIRLARKGKPRTIIEKLIEVIMALRLEFSYNKWEIFQIYASYAPFGGNVVGLEAASWRYFGRKPESLSWAEAATLAVLPNSPALIHPGRNRTKLLAKRNRLLQKLHIEGYIDKSTLELAFSEPLPQKPYSLPRIAPHLLSRCIKEGYRGKRIHSTIDIYLQEKVNELMHYRSASYKGNDYRNMAVLVLEVSTGKVLAYAGNYITEKPENGSEVDIINANRSTGSLLKPLLYAALLAEGKLTPNTLLPDVPVQLAGFKPENFNKTFDGAVKAEKAIARSLNIPAVNMLKMYGNKKFVFLLKKLGMTTLTRNPDYYGLAVILGGAEGKLWELTGIYASLARVMKNFFVFNGKYCSNDLHLPVFIEKEVKEAVADLDYFYLNAASLYRMFEAMAEVTRPEEEIQWQQYQGAGRIAWKTGTSFGYRDAWAIGTNNDYTVGVWVGNADGEGRPGMTGLHTAAPVLFDVFKTLPSRKWFNCPYDEMIQIPVCSKSGYRASDICENIDTLWVPKNAQHNLDLCPWHQKVFLDKEEKFRVNSDCESVDNMVPKSWFVLPPIMEWYYTRRNPLYLSLPPWKEGCTPLTTTASLDIVYPQDKSKIYLPVDIDGTPGSVVMQAAHRKSETIIYWHLDEQYIGSTQNFHQKAISPKEGKHILSIIDEKGEMMEISFEVINDNKKNLKKRYNKVK